MRLSTENRRQTLSAAIEDEHPNAAMYKHTAPLTVPLGHNQEC